MADTRRGTRREPRRKDPPSGRATQYLDLKPRQFVDTSQRAPLVRPAPDRTPSAIVRPPAATVPFASSAPEEPAGPVLTRRQFEAERQRLLREFGQGAENPGSFSCQGCRQCANCMFCVDCEGSYRCTHCTGCKDCSHCTHSEECQTCHGCAYCVRSSNCSGSSYLVLCHSCSDCTYCFGCVGLQKKDFHILNVKYGKTEYFRTAKALRTEMGF